MEALQKSREESHKRRIGFDAQEKVDKVGDDFVEKRPLA